MENAWSQAEGDHHAFTYLDGLALAPFESWQWLERASDGEERFDAGVMAVRVEGDRLVLGSVLRVEADGPMTGKDIGTSSRTARSRSERSSSATGSSPSPMAGSPCSTWRGLRAARLRAVLTVRAARSRRPGPRGPLEQVGTVGDEPVDPVVEPGRMASGAFTVHTWTWRPILVHEARNRRVTTRMPRQDRGAGARRREVRAGLPGCRSPDDRPRTLRRRWRPGPSVSSRKGWRVGRR
jgi:hypothetical protein